jgi:hypothetical protein
MILLGNRDQAKQYIKEPTKLKLSLNVKEHVNRMNFGSLSHLPEIPMEVVKFILTYVI